MGGEGPVLVAGVGRRSRQRIDHVPAMKLSMAELPLAVVALVAVPVLQEAGVPFAVALLQLVMLRFLVGLISVGDQMRCGCI